MTLAFLALLGAPYIYDISSLRVKHQAFMFRATYNSSFQMERVQGSAFSHQTKHFQILVPILKCV